MNTGAVMAAALAGSLLAGAPAALADDKAMIDANTERALSWLSASDKDTRELLEKAAGVLVFPDIVEMGFGVGGEFGEGALVVNGETVGYYATAGSTFGMGPQSEYKAEVIFFMTEEALNDFRERRSTKVGQHVSIPVAASGSAALASREDRVGIIFSEDGMVSDLVMEGDRITRISR